MILNPNNHLVIMAGGAGSRFWPLSSEEKPKQFLDVLGCGKTLIQLTLERFRNLIPTENVWVVTSAAYGDLVREQLPEVPAGNVLLEPCRRNTAPCVCYVSWKIKKRNPRANVVVAASDHLIADVETFRESIADALEFAAETDAIVTLGLRPTHPATGYGYIRADLSFSSSRKKNIFRVDAFKEKPSKDVAAQYVAESNYFWNSGIFVWSINTIVNAFRVYEPTMSNQFEALLPYYDTELEQEHIDKTFPQCENISIDYAILERAEEIYVYPASFGWSDIGSWSSLLEEAEKDPYGNAAVGGGIDFHECHHCMVHTGSLKRVVVQGLDGYVVAENNGTLLICKLSEEQRIKLFH